MNLVAIQNELSKKYNGNSLRYVDYLKKLESETNEDGSQKNWWIKNLKDSDFIRIFELVHSKTGLVIDGDIVLLQWYGGKTNKLSPTFTYKAYKNVVLNKYPETVFDIQLVKKGDEFNFKKENGKVIYKHEINNPFEQINARNITGAYCIIKNRNGEYLELMGKDDITKCRSSAKSQKFWGDWFDRMAIKTIIKRGCSTHFYDIVEKIETLDNENYDLEKVETEKPDNALIAFQSLIKGQLDELELIEQFKKMTLEEKKKFYLQIKQRIRGLK